MQAAQCPPWLNGIRKSGMPRLRLMESYSDVKGTLPSNAHVGYLLRTSPDWDYFKTLRDVWDGPLIVKGVGNPDDAARLTDEGADAIWVSNHAGRQFDGGPATIETLPLVRAATHLPIIFDSGIEGGLDVLRALALGADCKIKAGSAVKWLAPCLHIIFYSAIWECAALRSEKKSICFNRLAPRYFTIFHSASLLRRS